MIGINSMAETAALIGDPARAHILSALMSGRALTATELAHVAGVTAQTASGHLSKLLAGKLVAAERQGRHRYYRLHSRAVAQAIEALMSVASDGPHRHRPPGPRDAALRFGRTCYDHLAGWLGVALADRMKEQGWIREAGDAFLLTDGGGKALARFGIDAAALSARRRPLTRRCLDWSERRPHLGGAVGAALLDQLFARTWIERREGGRTVLLTPAGRAGLADAFDLPVEPAGLQAAAR